VAKLASRRGELLLLPQQQLPWPSSPSPAEQKKRGKMKLSDHKGKAVMYPPVMLHAALETITAGLWYFFPLMLTLLCYPAGLVRVFCYPVWFTLLGWKFFSATHWLTYPTWVQLFSYPFITLPGCWVLCYPLINLPYPTRVPVISSYPLATLPYLIMGPGFFSHALITLTYPILPGR
jgi:hypothetical protein